LVYHQLVKAYTEQEIVLTVPSFLLLDVCRHNSATGRKLDKKQRAVENGVSHDTPIFYEFV